MTFFLSASWRCITLLGLMCLFAGSCSLQSRGPAVGPWLPVLDPKALGQSVAVIQKVSGERDGEPYLMLFQLELSPDHMVMVASTGAGNTLFSLDYRNGKLSADRSPLVPAQMDPAFVLSDFQLAFWPLATVKAALLNSPYRLVEVEVEVEEVEGEGARRRKLFLGEELLVRIDYAAEDPWAAPVDFHNLRWHYRYRIETLQIEALQPENTNTNARLSDSP